MVHDFFPVNPFLAVIVSVVLNIMISIAGVIPSAFLTAWNIIYFGFSYGLAISILGEALGAIVSFILYRKGLTKLKVYSTNNSKYLSRLRETGGFEAFLLVIILRIVPFVPSGLVTLTAAGSKMGLVSFVLSSTIGKIPSLFIEAYSVNQVLKLPAYWTLVTSFILVAVFFIYLLFKRKQARRI